MNNPGLTHFIVTVLVGLVLGFIFITVIDRIVQRERATEARIELEAAAVREARRRQCVADGGYPVPGYTPRDVACLRADSLLWTWRPPEAP